MGISKVNRMASLVNRVSRSGLPSWFQQYTLTNFFNYKVKFAGSAGIWIESLTATQSVVHLANRRRVQNHIGGIHACGMALLAESATGMVFGMNVPDTHIPLIKSMTVEYKRLVQGDLKAVATLTSDQLESINSTDRGETEVTVHVTDEKEGSSPIACRLIWAWVPKSAKSQRAD